MTSLIAELPDSARVWIFALEGPDERLRAVEEHVHQFMQGWVSHARAVDSACTLVADRFLVIAGRTENGKVSGCGIDTLTHAVEEAAQRHEVGLLSPTRVFYRDESGRAQHRSRGAFRQEVRSGQIRATTPMFDLSVTDVGTLRTGAFEQPFASSWQARVFG